MLQQEREKLEDVVLQRKRYKLGRGCYNTRVRLEPENWCCNENGRLEEGDKLEEGVLQREGYAG